MAPTPESSAGSARARDPHWAGIEAAHAAAREHGFGRGRGGQGAIPCPVCHEGSLRYQVSGSNGHMMGRCSTPGCVLWIE